MPEQPYEAACMGGPLHGQIQLSRFPAGFVLVDKPRHMAWVYRWDGSVWRVDPGGHAGDNRWYSEVGALHAALGDEYDVIAAAGEG
ncbi:hypothetical protein [Catenuloplanes japonicus]|uniref:hypothetical protein n=1 Tax=Catenuloplanes japonicus TaxID=33876 RepID=UPI0012F7C0D9|nr:hypothetical protein [Catenuloplanes japonicus]